METILADLDALIDELEAELGALSDAQLDAQPADGGWSARETIGHVTITARLYDARIQESVARRPEGCKPSDKPHKPNWAARALKKWLPNLAKRFKAPGKFDPRRSDERFDVAGLLAAYRSLHATGEQVRALHMGPCKFGTPVSRLLRMKMRDAFEINALHARRHLVQIRRAAGLPQPETAA